MFDCYRTDTKRVLVHVDTLFAPQAASIRQRFECRWGTELNLRQMCYIFEIQIAKLYLLGALSGKSGQLDHMMASTFHQRAKRGGRIRRS